MVRILRLPVSLVAVLIVLLVVGDVDAAALFRDFLGAWNPFGGVTRPTVVNLGPLLHHEMRLAQESQLARMKSTIPSMDSPAASTSTSSALASPKKYVEASALHSETLKHVASALESWLDLHSADNFTGSVSKHITHVRDKETQTTTILYRPSLRADFAMNAMIDAGRDGNGTGGSGSGAGSNVGAAVIPLPHMIYHEEAAATFQDVLEKVLLVNPTDQFFFVGLGSGGAVALLHTWMAWNSVPEIRACSLDHSNSFHQVKAFLFDTDCVFTESALTAFPIPAWDILRFGDAGKVNTCEFVGMEPFGLAYVVDDKFTASSLMSGAVTRSMVIDYQAESSDELMMARPETPAIFNTTSVVASPPTAGTNDSSDSLKITTAIRLLTHHQTRAKLYQTYIKEIFRAHRTAYLQRDAQKCADSMRAWLSNTLVTPTTSSGLIDVGCRVAEFNYPTGVAILECTLVGSSMTYPLIRFRNRLIGEFDASSMAAASGAMAGDLMSKPRSSQGRIRQNRKIDDIQANSMPPSPSLLHRYNPTLTLPSNAASAASAGAGAASASSTKLTSRPASVASSLNGLDVGIINTIGSDFYIGEESLSMHGDDVSSIISTFSKTGTSKEKWSMCLRSLFNQVSYLNVINPFHEERSQTSVQQAFCKNTAKCDYQLLTGAKDYAELYRSQPKLFFSLFAQSVQSGVMPEVCINVLRPIPLSEDEYGNTKLLVPLINRFLNTYKPASIKDLTTGEAAITSYTTNWHREFVHVFNGAYHNLSTCLSKDQLVLYDCTSPLTLWAGFNECPDVCRRNTKKSHLCTRVVNCGDGIYLGFRGSSYVGGALDLNDQFHLPPMPSIHAPASIHPGYFSAITLRQTSGYSLLNLKTDIYLSVFFNHSAERIIWSVLNGATDPDDFGRAASGSLDLEDDDLEDTLRQQMAGSTIVTSSEGIRLPHFERFNKDDLSSSVMRISGALAEQPATISPKASAAAQVASPPAPPYPAGSGFKRFNPKNVDGASSSIPTAQILSSSSSSSSSEDETDTVVTNSSK